MDGVEGQQMGGGLGVAGGVVDVDDLEARLTPKGPEDQAADAPETVDAEFHQGRRMRGPTSAP
jgi:hypothetical protein